MIMWTQTILNLKMKKKLKKKGKMNRQSSEIQWMALFFKNKSEM